MSNEVYQYMCREDTIWFCGVCCELVRETLEEGPAGNPESAQLRAITEDLKGIAATLSGFAGITQADLIITPKVTDDGGATGNQSEGEQFLQNKESTWKTVGPKRIQTFKEILREATEEARKEEDLKKKMEKNLIIFKVPEASSENFETRKEHDKGFLRELIHQNLETSVEIVDHHRLGKRQQGSTGSRPLKVIFASVEEKNCVVRSL